MKNLQVTCHCQRFDYCTMECWEKDKKWHKCKDEGGNISEYLNPDNPFFKILFKSKLGNNEKCGLCDDEFCSDCSVAISDELTVGMIQEKTKDLEE